ncbi:cupin domain-containing protein [Thioalkalivibrio sp. HK1]|uniref:cupin domain-containing protein n=1 Tax=Thioalkalivibrio sp. HK1 TaxID=1469245 RepID=UPI0018CC09CC|nr:cupin domain-containing protein [Thioalkalivibrio sp. HK1]
MGLDHTIVRYRDLKPCKSAFIDAHTPGSDRKDNFTIIGAGVSENPDQHIHIRKTPGFNIGAAGQPPGCRNSLHAHRTAEVFFVLEGRWRFFWGRRGDAGEVVLDEGDIFNIPTGIFRGFENIGADYGMIMSILGGDDAGGGVIWAPEVIEEAAKHGMILGENGIVYDREQGERLPPGIEPMPVLTDEALDAFPEPATDDIVPFHVARHLDLLALSEASDSPIGVIGEHALLRDRPGFEVDFLARASARGDTFVHQSPGVLMPMRGRWSVEMDDERASLDPGDTMLIEGGKPYRLAPSGEGEACLYRVVATTDTAGPTWTAWREALPNTSPSVQ